MAAVATNGANAIHFVQSNLPFGIIAIKYRSDQSTYTHRDSAIISCRLLVFSARCAGDEGTVVNATATTQSVRRSE
jgi:hypothetical protein